MSHAALVEVVLPPTSDAAHRNEILEAFVLPEIRALPGFVRGVWMNDGAGTGTCVVVCATEDAARAALDVLTRAGGPPVLRSGIHEVEAEVEAEG